MDYGAAFDAAIADLHAEGRYRVFIDILRNKGEFPHARCFAGCRRRRRTMTVWCSNDYLGMGQHPAVIAAMEEALHNVGAGSGGTRNIGGNTHYHVELEAELADLHGKQAALLFTSGYISNEATLSTLGKLLPGCIIFSDEMNHASMIAGIRGGGCEKQIFRHNDREAPRAIAAQGAARRAQADRVRKRLFDGRRRRPDRRDLRPRRQVRRASPTSTKSTPSACTARAAAAFRSATGSPTASTIIEGTLGKAFGADGRLHRRRPQPRRCHPQLCAGLHLHDLAVARAWWRARWRACGT